MEKLISRTYFIFKGADQGTSWVFL